MDAEFANGKSVIPQPWSSTQETGFNYNDAEGYTYWKAGLLITVARRRQIDMSGGFSSMNGGFS
jgi:hypothetical protein